MKPKKEKPDSIEQLIDNRYMLQDQVFRQTAAMFKYCWDTGIAVSEASFQRFDSILQDWIDKRQNQVGTSISSEQGILNKPEQDNNDQELTESDQDDNGNNRNEKDKVDDWPNKLEEVAKIHNELVLKVAPATPKAILLIEHEMLPVSNWRYLFGFRFLGPIKIVRAMMGVSVVTLLIFLSASMSEYVNIDSMALSLFDLKGNELAYNLIFLLAAAGLGASFSSLFELRTYINNRTYDTVYATDYWIRFFLGLISGLILAELIPVQQVVESDSFISELGRPVLAMLGGFSVQVVYRILRRFVTTLETMIQGSPQQSSTAQQLSIKDQANKKSFQDRTKFMSELTKIQKLLNENEKPAKIKGEVDKIFDKLTSTNEI